MAGVDPQISRWLERLAGEGSLSADELRELEAHVYDSVEDLEASGLSEAEAAMIALHRTGKAEAVAREFQRAQPGRVWMKRLYWMTVGLLVFDVVRRGLHVAGYAAVVGLGRPGVTIGTLLWVYIGVTSIFLAGGLFLLRRLDRQPGGTVAQSLERMYGRLGRRPWVGAGIVAVALGSFLVAEAFLTRYAFHNAPIRGPSAAMRVAWVVQTVAATGGVHIALFLIVWSSVRRRQSVPTSASF